MSDPVSQIIELLRPNALHPCRQLVGYGDWAIRFPAERHRAVFATLAEGACWIDYPGSEPRWLEAGDFILMTEPPEWSMRSGEHMVPRDFREAYDFTSEEAVRIGDAGEGKLARILGGFFDFEPTNADLLTQLLPPVIVISSNDADAHRLQSILSLISDELSADRQAQQFVLSRLLELLLLESVRLRIAEVAATKPGMLAGLGDERLSSALRAIHADTRRAWTVDSLARRAGMSRSAFAEAFRSRVGVSPAAYVLQWRMSLAKHALSFTMQSLSEIAIANGYRSTAAFNTAFRRVVGRSPGAYARQVRT